PISALSAGRIWPILGEAGARGRAARAGALEEVERDQAARLAAASPTAAAAVEAAPERRSRRAAHCPNTFPEKISGIPHHAPALVAAACCAKSATRSPRPSITCPAGSR